MADISVSRTGMVDDVNTINLNGTQYPYALNATIETNSQEGNFVSIQNEGSNLLSTTFPNGFKVIGKLPIHEQNRTLFFLHNSVTNKSQIGEIVDCVFNDDTDDSLSSYPCADCDIPIEIERKPLEQTLQTPYCPYNKIVESSCLNFNIDFPVNAKYRITDCGINIYFTDGLNQRRYLYFNYTPNNYLEVDKRFKVVTGYTTGECSVPVYSEELDCNKIAYHPQLNNVSIELIDIVDGGSIKAGTVQFFLAFTDEKGNTLSNYTPATHPVPIQTRQITFDTNYDSGKAISLYVDNLDIYGAYGHYTIVVAETVDSFTTFKKIGVFPISQKSLTYTGNEENLIKLTPDDVFTSQPFYQTAGNITSANDFLFYTDLKEFAKPNLQRIANKIRLFWKTVAVNEPAYRDPKNTNRFKGYQRDEVYALGIIFTTRHGQEFGPYHIPGPSKEYIAQTSYVNVDAIVTNADVQVDTTCDNKLRNQYWQVYNTGFVRESPMQYSQDCNADTVWQWGDFAYWESSEKYPNDPAMWGDLCGKPIRHHKFPDSNITHIHDGKNGAHDFFYQNKVFPIGLRVDHNSVKTAIESAFNEGLITEEQKNLITSYRIIRGNRVGNKSIVAKGLLYDMWQYNKDNATYYYPNYPYNDLRPDFFISNSKNTYKGSNTSSPIPSTFTPSKRYTFHSPDVHFVNPSIGTEIKLETLEYGKSEGFFNKCEEQARYRFLSAFATTLAFASGVAAAFSAEKEKECKVVTTRSMQQIVGTVPGPITTIPAIPGLNYAPLTLTDPVGAMLFEDFTGLPIKPVVSPVGVTEVQRTTCRGKTFQLLNPASGNPAGLFLQQIPYLGIMALKQMDIMIELIKTLLPLKNFGIQYNSVGKYVDYANVANNGFKIRGIESSRYLDPIVQLANEAVDVAANQFTTIRINNWNRERSVYIKTDGAKSSFLPPSIIDDSRFTLDQASLEQDSLNSRHYRNISSYYGSIKNYVPDQYGSITDVEYIETNSRAFNIAKTYNFFEDGVFGGDTFISRFALKRKHPFFIQTRFRNIDESDVSYSELGNAGYPNYYFNTEQPLLERLSGETFGGNILNIVGDVIGVTNSRLDAKKNKAFYQSGFIHLYNYGIPFFLTESDVNVDYRHGENNLEKDFYPHQMDLGFWLQEKNVPITEDNYYFYNNTYSKQNKESVIGIQSLDLSKDCKAIFPSTIIHSEQQTGNYGRDNWLVFKANNQHTAPASYGRIIGVDGIENSKVLVRYENKSQIFGAYDTITTDNGTIAVGNGGLFRSEPQDFASVPLGYAGSQHTDLIQTEFGHIWVDAKRGQVFNLAPNAKGLDEISKNGKKNWFKENLPFQILKDFPTFNLKDTDNSYKGIGIALSFDKRFSRFFITKLDYKKTSPFVTYDTVTKKFMVNGTEVKLTDTRYFCNKSWTISYNFLTQSWVSFHSFTPNYYINQVDYTQSGINEFTSTLWSHNLTNKSFQVYYGKIQPFIIEVLSDPTSHNTLLNAVEYETDVVRYHNSYDTFHVPDVTFNKAIIFNDRECSGLLELVPRNENDMFSSMQYPKVEGNSIQVLVTNRENKWRFNQFYNTVNSGNTNVPFLLNTCSNTNKEINLKALNYFKPDMFKHEIRGKQTRIRLINDKESNYKFVHQFVQNDKSNSHA